MKLPLLVASALILTSFLGCGNADTAGPASPAPTKLPESQPSNVTTPSRGEVGSSDNGATSGPAEPAADSTANGTAFETTEAGDAPQTAAAARPAPRPRVTKEGEAEAISFDDLNCGMQADIQFRPWMLTERVQELDGQKVRVSGYMHPDAKQKGITEFVLLRNTECKFGPSGQADHLIRVKLKEGVTTSFSISPIEVTGILTVNPYTGPDGNTWSIFDLEGDAVGAPRR